MIPRARQSPVRRAGDSDALPSWNRKYCFETSEPHNGTWHLGFCPLERKHMQAALAIFVGLLFLSLVFVAVGWGLAWRLASEPRRRPTLGWLLRWSLKGLALPIALRAILNLGISWSLQ